MRNWNQESERVEQPPRCRSGDQRHNRYQHEPAHVGDYHRPPVAESIRQGAHGRAKNQRRRQTNDPERTDREAALMRIREDRNAESDLIDEISAGGDQAPGEKNP
jgi:hypothetical protein